MTKNYKYYDEGRINLKTWKQRLTEYYCDLYCHRFSWSGLAKEQDAQRYPERWLFYGGSCGLFKIPEFSDDPITLQYVMRDGFDPWGDMTSWSPYCMGPLNLVCSKYKCDWTNAAIIRDNPSHVTMYSRISWLLNELIACDGALQNNLRTISATLILSAPDPKAVKAKGEQYMDALWQCKPMLVHNGFSQAENAELYYVQPEKYFGDVATAAFWDLDARIRLMMGLSVNRRDKTAEIVEREAAGDDEWIAMARDMALEYRMQAVERFNEATGSNVQVKFCEAAEGYLAADQFDAGKHEPGQTDGRDR